jgi:hypothetical protein
MLLCYSLKLTLECLFLIPLVLLQMLNQHLPQLLFLSCFCTIPDQFLQSLYLLLMLLYFDITDGLLSFCWLGLTWFFVLLERLPLNDIKLIRAYF